MNFPILVSSSKNPSFLTHLDRIEIKLEVLNKELSRGEISAEEYKELKEYLEEEKENLKKRFKMEHKKWRNVAFL